MFSFRNGQLLQAEEIIAEMEARKMPPCKPMTLRFQFSNPAFSPVDPLAGTQITEKGTWAKVTKNVGDRNIWDWTCTDCDWSNAFFGLFGDPDNLVDIIDAGDTSGVNTVAGMFSNRAESNNDPSPYNYLRSCCLFDTSNVTNTHEMFAGAKIIERVPDFNTSKVERASGMFYHCTQLIAAPNLDLSHAVDLGAMFKSCISLKYVPKYNLSSARYLKKMFNGCYAIEYIPDMDTPNVTDLYLAFGSCYALKRIPRINTAKVTDMTGTMNACPALAELPVFDYSSATVIKLLAGANSADKTSPSIDRIPNLDTMTDKLEDCDSAFRNLRHVKYGILEAYNVLLACNPSTHKYCFTNCGIDTDEGRAQLEQIPASWGGLAS